MATNRVLGSNDLFFFFVIVSLPHCLVYLAFVFNLSRCDSSCSSTLSSKSVAKIFFSTKIDRILSFFLID